MSGMAIDIDRIRADTPGVPHGAHLLACGSSLMPQPVLDSVTEFLQLEATIGGYEAHADREEQLEGCYDSIAALVGGKPNEIAILEHATAAWCRAFYSLEFAPGDRVLTCEAEYGANYVAFLQRAKRDGIVIDVVPSDASGVMDLAALESMIDDRVKLIATTWIPTNGGLVNPAAEIGRIANEHGVLFLLDACQAVGQIPVDVGALGCDFLSATGRKFLRAPRGTGFLWIKESLIDSIEPAMIDHFSAEWSATNSYVLRPDARRFEDWENAYALRAGLRTACDYALDIGLEPIAARAHGLADRLRAHVNELAGGTVRDRGPNPCAIVSFTVEGLDPTDTVATLRAQGITIGTTAPSATRLDSEARDLPTMLRAAPHYYNTDDEIDALAAALRNLIT